MKTQFYFYSSIIHLFVLTSLFIFLKPTITKPAVSQIFNLDIIASSQEVLEAITPAQEALPKTSVSKPKSDDIKISGKKIKLSAPSILKDKIKPIPQEGGVKAEFADFPYPWYITQVRASLWNEWSKRMPTSGEVACVAVFKITQNGKIKDLEIEKSSGNKLFDFAASASVQSAADFPPLPEDYKEDELTVHVEFKVIE